MPLPVDLSRLIRERSCVFFLFRQKIITHSPSISRSIYSVTPKKWIRKKKKKIVFSNVFFFQEEDLVPSPVCGDDKRLISPSSLPSSSWPRVHRVIDGAAVNHKLSRTDTQRSHKQHTFTRWRETTSKHKRKARSHLVYQYTHLLTPPGHTDTHCQAIISVSLLNTRLNYCYCYYAITPMYEYASKLWWDVAILSH